MQILFDDCIKLSIPETDGNTIQLRTPYTSLRCPEEPPKSIKPYDGGLQTFQTEPIRSCSTEFLPYPETPKSVRSYNGGLPTLKAKSEALKENRSLIPVCLYFVHKLYLRINLSKTAFNLYFAHRSQNDKPHPKEPASKPLFISPYGAFQKSDSSFRDLLSSLSFSASLLFKVVLASLFQIAASETQSLMYYHTGVFQHEEYSYEFYARGFVNDHQIDKYEHNTKCDVPVASWMEKLENKSYWDRETNYRRGWEKVFKDNLRILKHRLNDSSIFLTLQLMYGCYQNKDGSVRGYYQYALNGRDFLYLDDKSSLWEPAVSEAQISAERWNTDPDIAESVKGYLTQHCTGALRRYIRFGELELNKRVRPEVKVWGRHESDKVTRLQCLVYGFYPRAVDVKWVRNGVDDVPSDEMSPILPHPDGTYQIRVSAEIQTRDGDTYSCHVDHSSLEDVLTVKWEPNYYKVSVRAALLSASLISIITLIFFIILFQARWPSLRRYSERSNIDLSDENCHCF